MQFKAKIALYWLTDRHWNNVTLRSTSYVTGPKIVHWVKYRYLDFLLKIYLHIFCERFEIALEDLGFKEKWWFEIWLNAWLNDLNPFSESYEIWVKDLMWDLPITAKCWYTSTYHLRWQRCSEGWETPFRSWRSSRLQTWYLCITL